MKITYYGGYYVLDVFITSWIGDRALLLRIRDFIMKKIINLIPAGVFSVLATAIVVYLLLAPPSQFDSSWFSWLHFKHSDKLIHFLLFFFLNTAYLYDYTKIKSPRHTKMNKELAITAFAAMIGWLSESAQLLIGTGRVFDHLDIVADIAGSFAALGIMRWFGGHVLRKYVFRKKHSRHYHHSSHSHHTHDSQDS